MNFINKLINTSSIRSQLFITVAVGIIILLFSAIYASTWVSNQQVRQVLIKQGMQATSNLADNSSLALLYDSPENAGAAIRSTLAFSGVTAVNIYKADKTLFYTSDKNTEYNLIKETVNTLTDNKPIILYEDKNSWHFLTPVIVTNNNSIDEQLFRSEVSRDPQTIGYVILISSKARLEVISKGILLSNLMIASVIGLLLLLALHKTINRLTQPLYAISEVMRKTEQEEYVPHINSSGPLEVHHIAKAYNHMINAMSERDEALRKQNIHLENQAIHDHLTGLINRIGFEQALEAAMEECKTLNTHHALCYMDLDKFKIVNDSCGHNAGDELLQHISKIFTLHIRKESDTLARVGGDEFALILKNCSINKAMSIGESICKEIENYRFIWDGRTFSVGVSIGITQLSHNTGSLREVISRADSACYIAKENGRGQVHVTEMGDDELANLSGETQIASQIIDHLENNKFQLYCQIIQPLKPNMENKVQCEILLRMRDNNGKSIPPDKFISSAERYDLMTRIDRWVISHTLEQLACNENLIDKIDICTININASSLGDEQFFDFLKEQFNKLSVKPETICFELTETTTLSNTIKANLFIHNVHKLGCRIALDDFVSNSSSFSHIKNMDIDYLKIHGDFFKNIKNNPVNLAMAKSINEIAHILDIETIAEHIEDHDSLNEVKAIGIDHAQGYLISEPLPLNEIFNDLEPA